MFRFQQYGYSPFQDIIEEVIQVAERELELVDEMFRSKV